MSDHVKTWKLVEIREADNRCVFTAQQLLAELRKAENANKKIAVLNIVGKFRGGKSFTLNFFLRYLKWKQAGGSAGSDWTKTPLKGDGFKFASGREPETKGIDVWPELLPFKNSKKEEFVVLLCDTQGLFDNQTEQQSCASIFGIATILASVLVLNTHDPLGSNDLSGLAQFIEFSCKALCGEEQQKSEEPPLQHLMFLIRNCTLATDYGLKAGNTHLEQLEQKATLPESRAVWNIVSHSYDQKSACLLPPPNNFGAQSGKLEEMGEDFEQQLRALVEGVAENLEPKQAHGQAITCGELAEMIEALAETFKKGDLPACEDVFQANVKAQLKKAADSVLQEFYRKLESESTGRTDFGELIQKHFKEAEAQFANTATWGDEEHQQAARTALAQQLNATSAHFKKLNELRRSCKQAEQQARAAETRVQQTNRQLADAQRTDEELKRKVEAAEDPVEKQRLMELQHAHEKEMKQLEAQVQAAQRDHELKLAQLQNENERLEAELAKA